MKGKGKGKVKAIPEGFHTITPHLTVRNATQAIEFYKQAFGAQELSKSIHHGKFMHADLKIGDSIIMLNDEYPEWKVLSPLSVGDSSVTIHLYVEDVDAAFNRAVSAGAVVTMPVMDAFWGDRYSQLKDPYGHKWSIATRKQELSEEEIGKAAEAFFAKMEKAQQHER